MDEEGPEAEEAPITEEATADTRAPAAAAAPSSATPDSAMQAGWAGRCWVALPEPWSKDCSTRASSITSPVALPLPAPPHIVPDAHSAAVAATAKLDALIRDQLASPLPAPQRDISSVPATRTWWPADSPGQSMTASLAGREEEPDGLQTESPQLSDRMTRHSFNGELVRQQPAIDSNGWEIIPPPTGLILAAAERMMQLDDLADDRRKEAAEASAATAAAVATAVAGKLSELEAQQEQQQRQLEEERKLEEVRRLEEERKLEEERRLKEEKVRRRTEYKLTTLKTPFKEEIPLAVEEHLLASESGEPGPDIRLHADQEGWRGNPAQDELTRGVTYREWVAMRVGRKGADLIADDASPDIVFGAWTCCESINPDSAGCLETKHSDQMLHCVNCGRWVRRGDWNAEQCFHHRGEVEQERWGGLKWACCGKKSMKLSKYGKVGVVDPAAEDINKNGVRFEDCFRSELHKKPRRKPVGEAVPIGMRWAHMLRQKRATAAETSGRDGCIMGRHEHEFRPSCSYCDMPLVSGESVASGPRKAAMAIRTGIPTRVCPNCQTVNRVCTQCERVVEEPSQPERPELNSVPENAVVHQPASSYVTGYQLPGAPPVPPPPPKRNSLDPPLSFQGFDAPCRFHPGIWCAFRRTRMALRQTKELSEEAKEEAQEEAKQQELALSGAQGPVVMPDGSATKPPPPSPPPSSPPPLPHDPPPTVKPDSPRRFSSAGAQTNPPKGKMVAKALQTISFTDASCQYELPVGVGSQTDELNPAWCKHTTKREDLNPPQSVILRHWSTLPRDFVIPANDRNSEAKFANGGFEMRNALGARSTGEESYLRGLLHKNRMRSARMRLVALRLMSYANQGSVLKLALRTWNVNAGYRRELLALLLPASFKIASVTRWRNVLASAPPDKPFALRESALRDELDQPSTARRPKLGVYSMIKLMHSVTRWSKHVAEDQLKMRAQLQWIGVRMRNGQLVGAWMLWKGLCTKGRFAQDPTLTENDTEIESVSAAADRERSEWTSLVASIRTAVHVSKALENQRAAVGGPVKSPKRFASPATVSGATAAHDASPREHGERGLPMSTKVGASCQTERSWEWQTETERRGEIHWPAETTEIGVQTSRRSFVMGHAFEDKATLTDLPPPPSSSIEVQTDYHEAYGVLNFTRRTGRAAEDKIAAMQKANADPVVLRAVSAANARIRAKLAAEAAEELRQAARASLKEKTQTTTTWAYTTDDRHFKHRTRHAYHHHPEKSSASSLLPSNAPSTCSEVVPLRRAASSATVAITTPQARSHVASSASSSRLTRPSHTRSADVRASVRSSGSHGKGKLTTPGTIPTFGIQDEEDYMNSPRSDHERLEKEPELAITHLQSIAAVAAAISADLERFSQVDSSAMRRKLEPEAAAAQDKPFTPSLDHWPAKEEPMPSRSVRTVATHTDTPMLDHWPSAELTSVMEKSTSSQ